MTPAVLAQEVGALEKPDIEWSAITPVLILIGGALLLLTVSALVARRPPRSTYAVFTVVTCAARGWRAPSSTRSCSCRAQAG